MKSICFFSAIKHIHVTISNYESLKLVRYVSYATKKKGPFSEVPTTRDYKLLTLINETILLFQIVLINLTAYDDNNEEYFEYET